MTLLSVHLVTHNRAKAKVVRIIGRLNVGGPARQACFLHHALPANFETVLIAGRLDEQEGDMSYLLDSEERVYWVPSMSRSVRLWSDFLAFLRILCILSKEKPDIVHTHTAKAGALGRVAAAILRVPVRVHTYHGHVFHGYFGLVQTRLWLAIERTLNRFTSRTVTISESQAKELVHRYKVAPRNRVSVIHNGYDFSLFGSDFSIRQSRQLRGSFGFDDSHFVILWAGRLVPVKNVELLAEVVRRAQRSPRLRFLVVGDGIDRRKLEKLTAACSNISMTGWRRDMPVLWAAADAALVTSRNEGTPTALIEAMASRKPFVSTNVGGVIDLAAPPTKTEGDFAVIQAANGFLTPAHADRMLDCLESLAANPDLALTMGNLGRTFAVARYSHQRLQSDIEHLYDGLLSSSSLKRVGQARPSLTESA
jgi:glycosyltransferase involved in cell wall biosynthesis